MMKAILKIIIVIVCIIIFLLQAWYWGMFYLAVENDDIAAMVAAVISAVVLIILSICGIFVSLKEKEHGLGNFAVAMISMFIWGIIQLALVIVSYKDCDNEDNPLTFICDLSDDEAIYYFYFPASLLLLMNCCGGVFGCVLKREIHLNGDGTRYWLESTLTPSSGWKLLLNYSVEFNTYLYFITTK